MGRLIKSHSERAICMWSAFHLFVCRALLKLINADNPFLFTPVVKEAICDHRPLKLTTLGLGMMAELG